MATRNKANVHREPGESLAGRQLAFRLSPPDPEETDAAISRHNNHLLGFPWLDSEHAGERKGCLYLSRGSSLTPHNPAQISERKMYNKFI